MTAGPPPRSRRDRIVDVTCVTLAALIAAIWMLDAVETRRAPGWFLLVALLLSVPACAAVWWRRRWPVGLALFLVPVSAVAEAAGGAVLVAVFTVAVHRRLPVTLAIAALHVLVIVPYTVILPDPLLGPAGTNALNVVFVAAVVLWGQLVRRRRRLVAELRSRAAHAEAEAALYAERIRGVERERIAREMHDVLAHRISLVSLHAGALEVRPDLPTDEVARAAATIRASAHQALEDLREILGVLRAGEGAGGGLGPQPGLSDLEDLVAEARAGGTPVSLQCRLPQAPPPSSAGRTAYRIVQEGLTNARKHAPGAQVRIDVERTEGGELHVWLRNPLTTQERPVSGRASVERAGSGRAAVERAGAGRAAVEGTASAIPGSRSGLLGLAERVALAGGRIVHGARRAGDGGIAFHLEAWLPWPM
jgi:signal transduction histidine kinase